jgi:Cell wall-associated hydrolases (invasion-associated proteins)
MGLDCAGLLLVVAHDLGLTDWDCVNYSRQVDCDFLRECVERFCDRVEGEMQAGDVLLLSIHRHPQHLALYAGEGMIIHAHESAGRVVLHRFDRFWERRLEAVYRWRMDPSPP